MIFPITVLLFVIFLGFLFLSFFFSGMEAGFLSLNKEQYHVDLQQGKGKLKRIEVLVKNSALVLAVTLLGNNLSNIAVVITSNRLWNQFFGVELEAVFVITSTLLLLLLGEIIPKLVFRSLPRPVFYDFANLLLIFHKLFAPMIYLISKFTDPIVERIFDNQEANLTRQDLSDLLEDGHEQGVVVEKEKLFVENFSNFSKTRVEEIMTPLVDIFMVPKNQDLTKVFEKANNLPDMIPVYDRRIDNIIGFVSLTKAFFSPKKKPIARDFYGSCFYIPESVTLEKIPDSIIYSEVPLVVIDEHGGCCGIVDPNNLLHNLFGFSYDPKIGHKESLIKEVNKNVFLIEPSFDIDHFNRMFDQEIEKDGFETLGGLIIHLQGGVPKSGTVIKYKDFHFNIVKANKTAIESIEMNLNTKVSNKTKGQTKESLDTK